MTPQMLDDTEDKKNEGNSTPVEQLFFKSRNVIITGAINDKLAQKATTHLLALAEDHRVRLGCQCGCFDLCWGCEREPLLPAKHAVPVASAIGRDWWSGDRYDDPSRADPDYAGAVPQAVCGCHGADCGENRKRHQPRLLADGGRGD